MQINFIPIKTRIVNPPKDEVWDILDSLDLKEGDIVFITSKILGIHQGRCVPIKGTDKLALIKQEATHWLPYVNKLGYNTNLTITDNILIPAAGIDESNANGYYIMWPKETDKLCREIRAHLCKKHGITNLGIVSTDSHSVPLRYGIRGIATGFAGLKPINDLRGKPDIFGRLLKISQANVLDPLAEMAVLIMGEGNEQTPIVILRDWGKIDFDPDGSSKDLAVDIEIDFYAPLYECFNKSK